MSNTKARKRTRKTQAVRKESVSLESKSGKDVVDKHEETQAYPVHLQDCDNPAYVRVGAGITRNMGDYNSIRVDISISAPCLPTEKAIDVAYKATSKQVDRLMDEEFEKQENVFNG